MASEAASSRSGTVDNRMQPNPTGRLTLRVCQHLCDFSSLEKVLLHDIAVLARGPGSCCNHTTMLKTLTIVLGLAAFAGCKTDAPASEKPSETTAAPSNAKPRSGKIDLPNTPPRPALADEPEPASDGERDAVTQQAREERRKQRMAEIDTDGDGVISEAEREAARAKREAQMKERLDTNKDGKIDEAEREAARHARAEDMHARLDKNGDGKLTLEEMQTGRIMRNADPSVDTNGDGSVSVEEIDAMMKNRPERGPMRRGGWRGTGGDGGSAATPPAQ